MEPLQKMAVRDIAHGERLPNGDFSYTKALPEHLQSEYDLVVAQFQGSRGAQLGDQASSLGAYIYHKKTNSEIGRVGMGLDRGEGEIISASVDKDHTGKGLGTAAYEALIAHGRRFHGLKRVVGSSHSSMAHGTHTKLMQKHPEWEGYEPVKIGEEKGPFDDAWGDYEYTIKAELMKKEDLSKAQDPKGFHEILKLSTPLGDKYVDHKPDLSAHPPSIHSEVHAYRNDIQASPGNFKSKRVRGEGVGISQKNIFTHPTGTKFMVKPYHERVIKRVKNWQQFPIQGWAEMTNQSLYHSADIGHLHQKVHVSEHNMQRNDSTDATSSRSLATRQNQRRGGTNEPALVIHMEPNLWSLSDVLRGKFDLNSEPVHKDIHVDDLFNMPEYKDPNLEWRGDWRTTPTGPAQYYKAFRKQTVTPKKEDLQKIAVMDFLSNNLDRHYGNLMFREDGTPLAIDHSRSFQYANTHETKGFPRHHVASLPMDKKVDSISHYIEKAPAMYQVLYGKNPSTEWENTINNWWPTVSKKVVQTMQARLQQIKDPNVRKHIENNFMARVKHLDEMASLDVNNFGQFDWHETPVPHYSFGENP
jgi:GNAT superfamily N-acetyltransferase